MMTRCFTFMCMLVVLGPASAAAQSQQFHKPLAPIGPTSEAQCQALSNEWDRTCQQISTAHQACLDANKDVGIKGAGTCSKAPCLNLHIEMDSCGGAERRQAIDACYASVRDHKGREAMWKRQQEEALREQQRLEQERQARFAAEADKSKREAEAARMKAAEYRAKVLKRDGTGRTEMSYTQAAQLDALRAQQQARAENRPAPNAPPVPAPHEAIPGGIVSGGDVLDLAGRVADWLKLPLAKEGVTMGKAFAVIHDGRATVAEAARERFNEAFRRERPDDHTFNLNECSWNQASCARTFDSLSPDTRDRYLKYLETMDSYVRWTDLSKWTEAEQKKFLGSIGQTLGNKAAGKVTDWMKQEQAKNRDWDPAKREDISLVRDPLNARLKKTLDEQFKQRLNGASPNGSRPPATGTAPDPIITDEMFERYKKVLDEYMRTPTPDPLPSVLSPAPPASPPRSEAPPKVPVRGPGA